MVKEATSDRSRESPNVSRQVGTRRASDHLEDSEGEAMNTLDIDKLKVGFNRASDSVRLITLLSPT